MKKIISAEHTPRTLTAADVAVVFGVDDDLISRWARMGKLTAQDSPDGPRFSEPSVRREYEANGQVLIRCRADLRIREAGHTVTVERMDALSAFELDCFVAAGDRVVVERTDGRFGTIPAAESGLPGGVSIEDAARSYAKTYGARYVAGAGAGR